MDLIRLIKLKKINGELDNLTEQEELFFSFFNGLYSVKENNNIYLFNKSLIWFNYDLKNNILWCSYTKVWLIFIEKYELNFDEFNNLIISILEKYLNLVGITIGRMELGYSYSLETHLNLLKRVV